MTRITDEAVEVVAGHFYTATHAIAWSQIDPHSAAALNYKALAREALEALPHLEGAAPEWTDEERDFVETALAAADAGRAGHWPTVATYLAAEVRRLRAQIGGAS